VRERDAARLEGPARDRARFVLAGRLHEDAVGLRVSARLLDRSNGQQVWADDYTAAEGTNASLIDAAGIVAARVAAEEGIIVQLLATERRQPGAGQPTPYDAMLRGYEFFLTRDPERFVPAVEALRRVVAAQPECGPAWTRLARLYLANYAFELTSSKTPIDEAVNYAQIGVRLDAASRRARCILASTLLVKGELERARSELEQALRSAHNSVVYLEIIGFLLTLLGDSERGIALSAEARRRNPHCLPHVWFGLWADHMRRGELEPAYQAALEYGEPAFFWRAAMRASALGLLGRSAEARAEVEELLRQKPDFALRGRTLLGYYLKPPELLARVTDGLARAGLELA
jgi:tetratricopeptide (TPR) repeat protein